eukprot:GHRR01029460.1.p1 GENE.GHRR01029460.1~~GHRR01029460.1.p1  ORF type:complete len:226 (+),score=54.63 GHRR01029460.1:1583-2260(+)
MEGLVRQGLVRSIGLSNFSRVKLQQLMDSPTLTIKPAVLQVEAHPYWPNTILIDWAQQQGIHVTAYSPLGSPDSASIMRRGKESRRLMEDAQVLAVAGKYNKSPAQVLIRWALERGTSCLPKSANEGRIAANFQVLDWQLDPADTTTLSNLKHRVRACFTCWCLLVCLNTQAPALYNMETMLSLAERRATRSVAAWREIAIHGTFTHSHRACEHTSTDDKVFCCH